MKRTVLVLLCSVLLAAGCGGGGSSGSEGDTQVDATGIWEGNVIITYASSPGMPEHLQMIMQIQQNGSDIQGVWEIPVPPTPPGTKIIGGPFFSGNFLNTTIAGNVINGFLDDPAYFAAPVQFSATVNGNSLDGNAAGHDTLVGDDFDMDFNLGRI